MREFIPEFRSRSLAVIIDGVDSGLEGQRLPSPRTVFSQAFSVDSLR